MRLIVKTIWAIFFSCIFFVTSAQQNYVSKVWVADIGDGTYRNPVLHADYSDPDVIRVGADYYLIASSFDAVPGIPILHSNDMVNWSIIGHALLRQLPVDLFTKTQHGNGVWAPSIRFHKNEFYIFYPDPDFGIYLTKAKNILGPWSDPILVEPGKGLIDPCPFWDDDGKAYLIHAFAGSRAGIKSILVVKPMNADGNKIIGDAVMVYDGHALDPTVEGPKLYKRNGYYFIFAPAGGVSTGWQLALRSKNIYGPYERKVVMDQGTSSINGPHQGAWVQTQKGEDWFIHFQDKGVYGRVVHLQPMKWINDWPVIGADANGIGKGTPVGTHKKPDVGRVYPVHSPMETDEFNTTALGLQWQWQANPKSNWVFMTGNQLRLNAQLMSDSAKNYWDAPNLLLQKFPAEEFTVTTKCSFKPASIGDRAGLVIMGADYASLSLVKKSDDVFLQFSTCHGAAKGAQEQEVTAIKIDTTTIYLMAKISKGGVCHFSYSTDNIKFIDIGISFNAQAGRWIGAKMGLFCMGGIKTNDSGYAEFDWFRIDQLK